jgi:hypothetical protein
LLEQDESPAKVTAEWRGETVEKVRSHSSGAVFFDSLVSGSFPFRLEARLASRDAGWGEDRGREAGRCLSMSRKARRERWLLLFAEVELSGNGF